MCNFCLFRGGYSPFRAAGHSANNRFKPGAKREKAPHLGTQVICKDGAGKTRGSTSSALMRKNGRAPGGGSSTSCNSPSMLFVLCRWMWIRVRRRLRARDPLPLGIGIGGLKASFLRRRIPRHPLAPSLPARRLRRRLLLGRWGRRRIVRRGRGCRLSGRTCRLRLRHDRRRVPHGPRQQAREDDAAKNREPLACCSGRFHFR